MQDTVIGNKTFHNIIATFGPKRDHNMILACHYESKLMAGFVGSIDSAMPCSIILLIAEQLSADLSKQLVSRLLFGLF